MRTSTLFSGSRRADTRGARHGPVTGTPTRAALVRSPEPLSERGTLCVTANERRLCLSHATNEPRGGLLVCSASTGSFRATRLAWPTTGLGR
jgi:hypothetical protein